MEYKESIYIIDKKDIIKCEKNKLAKLSDYTMLDDTDSDRIKLVILNERLSIFEDCEIWNSRRMNCTMADSSFF